MFFKVKNATTYLMRSKGQGLAGQVMLGKVLASRDQAALAEGVVLSPVEEAELAEFFAQRRTERQAGRESKVSLTEAASIVRQVELVLVGHAQSVSATELTQIGDDVRRLAATVRQLQDELTELGPVVVPEVAPVVEVPGETTTPAPVVAPEPVPVPGEAVVAPVVEGPGEVAPSPFPGLPALPPSTVKARKKPSVRERFAAFVGDLTAAFRHLFGRW